MANIRMNERNTSSQPAFCRKQYMLYGMNRKKALQYAYLRKMRGDGDSKRLQEVIPFPMMGETSAEATLMEEEVDHLHNKN